MWKAFAVVAILAASITTIHAQDIAGRASVIDGDTIEIHGERICLWGIDAPEHDQLCRNDDSDLYRCGQQAAIALARVIEDVSWPLVCRPINHDVYGRTVATCSFGMSGPDVGGWLVDQGHALDWPLFSKGHYSDTQQSAKKAGRGIWAGSFVEPWRYRACIKRGGRIAACSDEPDG